MFPIGESLAIRNLEPAVSAGNGRSAVRERPDPRSGFGVHDYDTLRQFTFSAKYIA